MSDKTTDTRDAATGRLLRGHIAAQTTGVQTFLRRGPDALDDGLREEHFAFRSAVYADLGGEEQLSTLAKSYVERLAELNTVANLLALDLAKRGILSPRGRVRSSLDQFMKCLDRWDKLAQRIGMERRPKRITVDDLMNTSDEDIQKLSRVPFESGDDDA